MIDIMADITNSSLQETYQKLIDYAKRLETRDNNMANIFYSAYPITFSSTYTGSTYTSTPYSRTFDIGMPSRKVYQVNGKPIYSIFFDDAIKIEKDFKNPFAILCVDAPKQYFKQYFDIERSLYESLPDVDCDIRNLIKKAQKEYKVNISLATILIVEVDFDKYSKLSDFGTVHDEIPSEYILNYISYA